MKVETISTKVKPEKVGREERIRVLFTESLARDLKKASFIQSMKEHIAAVEAAALTGDYVKLRELARGRLHDFKTAVNRYSSFLSTHPGARHRAAVETIDRAVAEEERAEAARVAAIAAQKAEEDRERAEYERLKALEKKFGKKNAPKERA